MARPVGHSADLFPAVIRGGPHDGHVHLFPFSDDPFAGRMMPPGFDVPGEDGRPDGRLRLVEVTDATGRPVYVYEDNEGRPL